MNDKLFYLIWRNIVLRSKIIGYLSFHNLHSAKRYITSIDDLKCLESQYYRSVELQLPIIRNDVDKKLSLEMLDCLPNSVTNVTFTGYGFGKPLNLIESLPSNVISLKFGGLHENDLQITGKIPNTLKTLILGSRIYNKLEFDSMGNQSLTYLDIGSLICIQKTNSLPSSLITFKCCSPILKSFNIDSLLSSSLNLTSLDFSGTELSKFINEKGRTTNLSTLLNLKYLNLGQSFNNIIPYGYLPNQLETLILPLNYNTNNIKVKTLPNSITKLCFQPPPTSDYYNPSVKWIPSNKLYILKSKLLPLSLIKLNMGSNHILEWNDDDDTFFNQFSKITFTSYTIDKSNIPKSITKLKVISYSNVLISIPIHIKSLSLNGNIRITNSKELNQLTNIKIINGWLSNCYSINSPLKTINCNSINVKVEINDTVKSLSTMNYNSDMIYSNSLTLLEFTSISIPVDTFLLPSSIHTLIIRSAPNIIFPLSPNIKTIYINSLNEKLLQNLNLFKNIHLLNIFKVIDIPFGPCTNVFKKLSLNL